MVDSDERLRQDLDVMEAMVAELEVYLRSDALFWQMESGNLPRLTLGGYLVRAQRLLRLRHLLSTADQNRLDKITAQFETSLQEKVVRFETKAHEELDARLRQWTAYLQDLRNDVGGMVAGYGSHVETRAMIQALIDRLQMAPYELQSRVLQQLEMLDKQLQQHWQTGAFIWPEAWQPAYPPDKFWWLYGRPRVRSE